jgi:hypothetical protein
MNRVRGDWTKSKEDVVEPDRTERLLAHPVVLLRPRAGDAIDGNKLLWLNRASGSYGISGILYEWLLLLIQLSIAILTGIGPRIEPGSPEADAQMFAVICLQYGIAVYTMFGGPSADRIDNFVITAQYLTEGTCTLLLLVSGFPELFDLQPLIQMAVFLLLLFGMFIPILEKGYEAIVVQLIRCVYNMKGMSVTECCIAIVGFLAVIPSMLAALIGMDTGDGLLETFLDEGVNAAASVAEEAEAIAAVMDNLLFNMRQKYAASKFNVAARKRYGKKQKAATKVQSKVRGHQVRTKQRWQGAGQKPLAAVLIQRAFLTKRNLKREGVSLRKVQMNQIRYRTALKSRVGIGSHWTKVGPQKPTAGSEIFSKRLEAALRTKQEFSDEEIATFEVLLRIDSFIKVDEQYFEQAGGGQAAGLVSKAKGSLSTESASSPKEKRRIGTSRRGRQAKRRMAGEEEWGSFSSFGISKALSPNSKQPPGRSLLEDVHAATEPAEAETAVVEPVAAQTRSPLSIFGRTKRTVTNPSDDREALFPSGTSSINEAGIAAAYGPTTPPSLLAASSVVPAAVEPVAAVTEATFASPAVEAAREAAAREAAARGDLAFLAFVTDPKAAVAVAALLAWDKSGASEMEVALAQEHLERQNTEAATLTRQKIAQSERLKRLEEEAAVAIEELEAATAETREAAAKEAAVRGDLAFLAFVADPKAAASAAFLGGGVVSERESSQVNFSTWDASRDSIASSEAEMRPGMQWLIENMNRTTLMFDADEDDNNEDGTSVDLPEQHPDRNQALVPNLVYRFETVQERVTRARASLPSGLPKSVPGIHGAAKFRSTAKSLGKRPGKLPLGLSPGLLPSSAPNLSAVSPASSIVEDVRRCGGGAASSSSEPERNDLMDHV